MRPDSPTTEIPLERLVFLSNSVPKSGSTFLAALQENFIYGLKPRRISLNEELQHLDVDLRGNYVMNPYEKDFLHFISNKNLENGPYIFKTHLEMKGDIKDIFLSSKHIHASLSVRDPLEIFMSGRDNHLATGEFPEFAELDSGIKVIRGYFAEIFKTTKSIASIKEIPIVRYDEIVKSPKCALLKSFSRDLRSILITGAIAEKVDIEAANELAQHRRNKAEVKRDLSHCNQAEIRYLKTKLSDIRKCFGY
jgi:hypothetical protein